MNRNLMAAWLGLTALLFVGNVAQAHPGHGPMAGFSSGFQHPLTGWDHFLAALAVGLWAAQQRGRARWFLPISFLTAMALGMIAGPGVFGRATTEAWVLVSLLALGGLIAFSQRMPLTVSALVVAVFAWFHGTAHGIELPVATSFGVGVGLVLATALMHLAGIALGVVSTAPRGQKALRMAGAAIAAAGLIGLTI